MNPDKTFLLISNMYPSADSPGFGSFVKNVCAGMQPFGVRMKDMAVIRGRGKSTSEKLRKYLGFYTSIIRNFFKKHDFVYVHFPNQAVPLLRILYLLRRSATVVNYHGEDLLYSSQGMGNRLGRMTENFCRRYATRIVVPSQYFKDIVVERGIAPAERVIVSPSGGINPDVFYPDAQRSFISDGIIRLGCVGRLEPGKGALEFVQSCKVLSDRGIPYRATIIGYGSLKQEIERYIADNKLESDITLIDGIPQKELGDYYRSFDMLIFMSSAESLGLTGIESMACGTPVIGSAAGGISSYLRDSVNGFRIPSRRPEDVADAVAKFIAMTDAERQKMSEACISTGQRYYTPAVCRELASELSDL